jgi:NitT/TauT family transport system substrate-binding protein
MAKRLTTFSKLLITILLVALIFLGGRYLLQGTSFGKSLADKAEGASGTKTSQDAPTSTSRSGDDDDVVKIGVVTWGGYAGGQYFNEGFKANRNSRFYKDYGFEVDFKVLDDFEASRQAFKNDDVNLLWATIDAFPTEVNGLRDFDPVVLFQADWSRGGDAIVARRGITKVSDLKGKKIAVAEYTPSQSFLLWLLDAGGLTSDDVDIVFQASAIDAAEVFKSQNVDAAVVWSPDDIACVQAVPGARVLESTKSASNIIADVFIAKRAYVEANREKMAQLYEGWMIGASEINSNDANKRKAAKILGENFEVFSEQDAYDAINNVRLVTHGDNQNFFGLNRNFKGVTGNSLYSKMVDVYDGLGYIEGRAPNWRLISYSGIVEEANLTGRQHAAEEAKSFAPVSTEDKTKEALASKEVTINFSTGNATLDENAKYIIDRDFVGIAKAFGNSRIRIEGNTDNTGSRELNVSLSRRRAQAVADYLISEHNMPRNRLIVVGNGPDQPVASNNTESGRAKNRRTDFELVSE